MCRQCWNEIFARLRSLFDFSGVSEPAQRPNGQFRRRKIWHSLSHQIDFEGPSAKNIFFFSALCGEDEKQQNQLLVTKRGQNRKSMSFLKSLDVNYINVLAFFIAPNIL